MYEDAIESLCALGFDRDEAMAYCALLEESPLSGYALSQKTGISRSHIYEVLESLYRKGCVTVSYDGASEYAAIPYEQMLETHVNSARENRKEAVKQVRTYVQGSKQYNLIRNIYSAKDVYNVLIQQIAKTQDYILMKIWAQDIREIESALCYAAKRGVELHIVVMGDYHGQGFPYYCYAELKNEQEFRSIDVAFGNREIFCGSLSDGDECFCASTQNYCLRVPVYARLLFDLELADLYQQDGERLKEKFGCDLIQLRRKYQ